MTPTMYIITHYQFNHSPARAGARPIDGRFLDSERPLVYYLIDRAVPEILKDKNIVQEHAIDPLLHQAGGTHLAEWSFLLAEAKHAFCKYPFFMLSSRFYEKNHWLSHSVDVQWDRLFAYFSQYRFGFLPSYDRPLRWLDLDQHKKPAIWRPVFFPWQEASFALIATLYGVRIPEEYRWVSDLQCNYIGFRDRQALLEYVHFYLPLIEYFFDETFALKRNIEPYVQKTGWFSKEKPFTFLLEVFSHFYFFVHKEKIFALHYDGYYEVDERATAFRKLVTIPIGMKMRVERMLRWQWRRAKSEGIFAPLYTRWQQHDKPQR